MFSKRNPPRSRGSSSTAPVLLLIVGLIAGSGGVYFLLYQPGINEYENKISNLTSEVSDLTVAISNLESKISELESLNSDYESQVSQLKSDLSETEGEIDTLESRISTLQIEKTGKTREINLLKSKVEGLESRLDIILDITVTQHYEWEYGTGYWASTWYWNLPIPLSLYIEYYERARPESRDEWVDMATDPGDDYYIDYIVKQVNSAAIKEGFTEREKINFVIGFVQSLPYTVDDVTTSWDEYPRYPIETLFDRGGDCEDTSILTAALLERMGYDVCLLILDDDDHMAVGVSIEGTYGTYYDVEGVEYFYLETTGEGWKIGEKPSDLISESAYVYTLNP